MNYQCTRGGSSICYFSQQSVCIMLLRRPQLRGTVPSAALNHSRLPRPTTLGLACAHFAPGTGAQHSSYRAAYMSSLAPTTNKHTHTHNAMRCTEIGQLIWMALGTTRQTNAHRAANNTHEYSAQRTQTCKRVCTEWEMEPVCNYTYISNCFGIVMYSDQYNEAVKYTNSSSLVVQLSNYWK